MSFFIQQVEDELGSSVVLFRFSQDMSAGMVLFSEFTKLRHL